jgi:biotin carboxyl carrier protein
MRKFQVTVNGNTYEVDVEELASGAQGNTSQVTSTNTPSTSSAPTSAPSPAPASAGTSGDTLLEAPMQGKIVSVKVSVGDVVNEGDVVAVLEAMKMENEVVAPNAGTIASINVTSGQSVEAGDLIASLN